MNFLYILEIVNIEKIKNSKKQIKCKRKKKQKNICKKKKKNENENILYKKFLKKICIIIFYTKYVL